MTAFLAHGTAAYIWLAVILGICALALGLLAVGLGSEGRIGWGVFAGFGGVAAGVACIVFIFVAASHADENRKTERGRGDAPRPTEAQIDGRGADTVTEMPDGFGGVASKCVYEGVRAFVTTRASGYGSDLELWADETCTFVGTGPSR